MNRCNDKERERRSSANDAVEIAKECVCACKVVKRAKRGNRAICGFCLFLACIETSCLSDCDLLQKEAGNANLDILTLVSRCGIDECQL